MNDTIDDLDSTHEATFTYDVSDEELEALGVETVLRMWAKATTSCAGPSPGPGCGRHPRADPKDFAALHQAA